MNLIDFAGRTVIKTDNLWIKVAKLDEYIGIGIVSPDGTEMKSFWIKNQ